MLEVAAPEMRGVKSVAQTAIASAASRRTASVRPTKNSPDDVTATERDVDANYAPRLAPRPSQSAPRRIRASPTPSVGLNTAKIPGGGCCQRVDPFEYRLRALVSIRRLEVSDHRKKTAPSEQ